MNDKLDKMFLLREDFMKALANKKNGILPHWPIDIEKKESQQALRETILKGVEEMFEALGHLKNWKPHRQTEIIDFNRSEFLEEFVDGMNYFLSVLILLGHDSNDLLDAYLKKDKIIHERLREDY
jgi:dimeric dUTPase (all-alpha-NTP-PPase superfamily)